MPLKAAFRLACSGGQIMLSFFLFKKLILNAIIKPVILAINSLCFASETG